MTKASVDQNTEKEFPNNILVFGVFDGFHNGHQYFLDAASKYGQDFYVVVARDEIVYKMKNRHPKFTLSERIAAIREYNSSWNVISGDHEINTWEILQKIKPEIIVVGHDQNKLFDALQKIKAEIPNLKKIIILEPFEREKYSSTHIHHS